jgi:membrane associated rhomboid family serine protease
LRWPDIVSGIRRLPLLTSIAVIVAVVAAIVQYAVPAAVPALERDHDGLARGEWWRLVSPLFVQTLGWYQVLTNLVTLALFGFIAERLLSRWRWLLLLAAGTVAGQVAAYAWHEPGGGASIAICGLAGGTAVALFAGRGPVPWLAAHAVVYYVVALTGWGFSGILAAGLGCVVAGGLLSGLRWAGVPEVERLALAGAAACAVGLAAVGDLHGISLTAGGVAMLVVVSMRGRNGDATAGVMLGGAAAGVRDTSKGDR